MKSKSKIADGGYGWIIVIAAMIINFIVDGLIYAYSVMKLPLQEYFNVGEGMILLPGSLAVGIYMLGGPLYTQLCDRYGCRLTIMIGSLIGCIAMAISIASSNIYMLIVIYGIFAGLGFGLVYLPSIVVLSSYFDKKLTLATGIVVSGSGIGVLAFGQIAGVLFDSFGWKGGMLLLSGIFLNCAVCASLMRSPDNKQENSILRDSKVGNEDKVIRETARLQNKSTNKCCRLLNSFVRFDLVCDPTISVLCFANLFGFFAYLLVMMLLVTVTEKQIKTTAVQARFTMTCLGITNTIGRFLFGWIPGPRTCTIATINYTSLVICAIVCFLLPLFKKYVHAMIFAVIFGLFTAPFVGLTPAVIREAVGDELYSDALGIAFFFRGFSSIIGPTLGGYIYDATGSFNLPFFISGCAFIVCAVLHFIVKWTHRIKCGVMYNRIPKEDNAH